MLLRRHTHAEVRMVRWLLLMGLALVIIGLLASIATGATRSGKEKVETGKNPLQRTEIFPSEGIPDLGARAEQGDMATRLWKVLGDHERGERVRAIAGWNAIEMPPPMATWKLGAMGAAYIREGNLNDAGDVLTRAVKMDPTNPVMHYLMGVLRVKQAANAADWPDAVLPDHMRLVSYPPQQVAPNTKSMYQLAAMQEYELAIKHARQLAMAEPLCEIDWTAAERIEMPVIPPTVGDLMQAIGVLNFEEAAHYSAAQLYLVRGALEGAEHHFDMADEHGMNVGMHYLKLGRAYQESGRMQDAARVYVKAMTTNAGIVEPARQVMESLEQLYWE